MAFVIDVEGVGIAALIFVCILFFTIVKSHDMRCLFKRKPKQVSVCKYIKSSTIVTGDT